MSRIIWLICLLLICNWWFNWHLAAWKISEIHKASTKIEKHIDTLQDMLKPLLKDPSKWESLLEEIEKVEE